MAKDQTIRFAAGTPDKPFSGVWRLVASKNDVYLGASGNSMSIFKISLHSSGIWVLAATEQSGATFENGNRRAKKWNRPLEHASGVTRGPSVFVPHTSLGSRALASKEKQKKVVWYAGPVKGQSVEFSVYFVDSDAKSNWNADETTLADVVLASGDRVVLLASARPSPSDFLETCEKLLRENVFGMRNPGNFREGSFLWITQSRDRLAVPLIVDLPVPIKESSE
ncbi:MAG: hypothetical protein ACE5JQ_03745 [Candidatus Methylomirabilales bacterium]